MTDGQFARETRSAFNIIMRYCNLSSFKMAAVCHVGNLEMEIFNSLPHQTRSGLECVVNGE